MFALYAPAVFLASVCVIFFLSMCCLLHERLPADYEDDVGDALVNELDSVTPPTTNLMTAPTSSVMDLEYRPVVQLCGVVVVLFLYLFTWACGAFVVARPFGSLLAHREMVYNYLYGVSSAALGVFILVFYCLARDDARSCWRNSCAKKVVRSESVPMAVNHSNGNVARHGGSSEVSISVKSSNSASRAASAPCGPPKVTNISSQAGETPTEISLGSYPECMAFYNPRQNGIAKKYWQKNRLRSQLHKGLNTGGVLIHGLGDGSRTFSDDSFTLRSYGNGSDTNAHQSFQLQSQNPNLYQPTDSNEYMYGGLMQPGKYPESQPAGYLARGCSPGASSPIPGVFNPEVNSFPVRPATYCLPRSAMHADQPLHVNEFMQRNGSVPRLRDFDGQSHVSSQVTSSHELGAASVNSDVRTLNATDNGADNGAERPPRIASNPPPPSSSFMDQLQQRIPPSNEPRSSTPREQSPSHRRDASSELKQLSPVEKSPPRSGSQRTLEGVPDRPPRIPVVKASYAAVCRLSREDSHERLLPSSQRPAAHEPDESENLLPSDRHDDTANGGESPSNSEENDDDIWVPRTEKTKHETSV